MASFDEQVMPEVGAHASLSFCATFDWLRRFGPLFPNNSRNYEFGIKIFEYVKLFIEKNLDLFYF